MKNVFLKSVLFFALLFVTSNVLSAQSCLSGMKRSYVIDGSSSMELSIKNSACQGVWVQISEIEVSSNHMFEVYWGELRRNKTIRRNFQANVGENEIKYRIRYTGSNKNMPFSGTSFVEGVTQFTVTEQMPNSSSFSLPFTQCFSVETTQCVGGCKKTLNINMPDHLRCYNEVDITFFDYTGTKSMPNNENFYGDISQCVPNNYGSNYIGFGFPGTFRLTFKGSGVSDRTMLPVLIPFADCGTIKNAFEVESDNVRVAYINGSLQTTIPGNGGSFEIMVYDMQGSLVKSYSEQTAANMSNEFNFDVTDLQSGSYLYSVKSGNKMIKTGKFAISK